MSMVRFTATRLNGTNKRGILKPDDTGYYTMPIGGLNAYNSVGEYYTLEGAKHLFEGSHSFMRNINAGCLFSENGHPQRAPGMTMDDYLRRILCVDENNIIAHLKEVWLDESFGRNNPEYKNPNLVAIMAKVKPAGVKGESLKESFDNPDENICFSIRALTRDMMVRGVNHRVLQTIVTWDRVVYNGIANANKWKSPALETATPALEDIQSELLTKRDIENALNKMSQDNLVAMESNRIMLQDMLKSSFSTLPSIEVPKYSNW